MIEANNSVHSCILRMICCSSYFRLPITLPLPQLRLPFPEKTQRFSDLGPDSPNSRYFDQKIPPPLPMATMRDLPHPCSPLYNIWNRANLEREDAIKAENTYVQCQAAAYLILYTEDRHQPESKAKADATKKETIRMTSTRTWQGHFASVMRFYSSPEARTIRPGASDPDDVVEPVLRCLRSCREDANMKLLEVEVLEGEASIALSTYEDFVRPNLGQGIPRGNRPERPAAVREA